MENRTVKFSHIQMEVLYSGDNSEGVPYLASFIARECVEGMEPKEITVGYSEFRVFDPLHSDYSLRAMADNDSEASLNAIEELEFLGIEPDYIGRVAVIQTLSIGEDYQNHGLGTESLEAIIEFLKQIGVSIVVLKPYPIGPGVLFGRSQLFNKITQLIGFYEQFEFEVLDDTAWEPHMALRLDEDPFEDADDEDELICDGCKECTCYDLRRFEHNFITHHLFEELVKQFGTEVISIPIERNDKDAA